MIGVTLFISFLWALFLSAPADARSLLHSSGGAPAAAPFIASISPTSGSVLDNVSAGTTIARLQCFMNTGAACPAGVSWSLLQPYPSFIGLSPTQSDGTVLLKVTSTPGAGADGGPSTDSYTFGISANIVTVVPQVVSISPTNLQIPNQTAQGTQYQFTCTMNDGSSCTNKTWSFSNYPSFLTPGFNANGGTLTTNATAIPGSGTLTATVGGFSQPVTWSVAAPLSIASISPTMINIPSSSPNGTVFTLTCAMSDGVTPCTNKAWTWSLSCTGGNTTDCMPAFLTPGQDATGGKVTTNQLPPLPQGSGSFLASVLESFNPTVVQHQAITSVIGPTQSYTWNIPAVQSGDTIVGALAFESNNLSPASLDTVLVGNQPVYLLQHAAGGRFPTDTLGIMLWWLPNVQGSPTTMTFSTTQGRDMYMEYASFTEFSGIPATASIDGSATQAVVYSGSTNPPVLPGNLLISPTITPSQSGDLLYGYGDIYGSMSTWSAGAGWTILNPGLSYWTKADEWMMYNSTSPIAATFNAILIPNNGGATSNVTWSGIAAISPTALTPQITGVLAPNYFAAPGYSGSLTTTCTKTCPGTASYSLSTAGACAAATDNGSFSISGSTLTSKSNTLPAAVYLVGISVTMSEAPNSGTCYPVILTIQ